MLRNNLGTTQWVLQPWASVRMFLKAPSDTDCRASVPRMSIGLAGGARMQSCGASPQVMLVLGTALFINLVLTEALLHLGVSHVGIISVFSF